MSSKRIPRLLRQSLIAEFGGRCAYCHVPVSITGAQLVIDHIIPEVAGGQTIPENLCLACHSCNEFKGAQTVATDPVTEKAVRLFNPRQQIWNEHFRWGIDGGHMMGLSSTGRATIVALNLNHPAIVQARRRWASVGWHPPAEDG